ncbi:hypothetical protein WR25_17730 [Diploscapter pachys]|uniref:glutaminase n=1 Tax=Diploscapter pachys TaxID=2018661 RepID=A0A2A2LPG5_9BILA|nr:hypothetical protein WR25_17730 [Diploscapter pachys]
MPDKQNHVIKQTFMKSPSQKTLETLSEVLERKMSMSVLSKSLRGLSNPYEREDPTGREEVIFELFKLPSKNEASIGKLLAVLKSFGLREDDPRLAPMMARVHELEQLEEEKKNETFESKHWTMDRECFKSCISHSIDLISQAMQNDLVIPLWNVFTENIRDIYRECKEINEGKVATYIPQLARVSPDLWGVSVCTVDGQRASFGDTKAAFCVQSVSKAFNYAIASSADEVHKYVGQEPSGRLFNEICLDSKNKPHNPMVNSGAIIITSLIKNKWNMADRFDYVLNESKKIAGGEYIGFNNATFLSERATADRNFALAYYMKENDCFPPEAEHSLTDALDFYFQLCSVEGNCESLSVMAATLANGGVCPITNQTVILPNSCRDALSLMYSCGMYDASGQFSFTVGLPAKSGVSGAMIVVVPNVLGLCLYSPPLDNMGNTVRGVNFCKKLIARFNFHNYDSLLHTESTSKIDPRRRGVHRERNRILPIFHVARSGELNNLRRLFMQGQDMNAVDYDKRSALIIAASEGHEHIVKFLVNVAKVDINVTDKWGRTALDEARFFKHAEIARFLEKASERSSRGRLDSVSSIESDDDTSGDGLSRASFHISPTDPNDS